MSSSGGQHPLLNTLICYQIFQCLGSKDLKSARLVCKTWRSIASGHLGNRSTIAIQWKETRRRHNKCRPTIGTFLEYVGQNEGQTFYRKFDLLDWLIDENVQLVQRFFSSCGGLIQSLTFSNGEFPQKCGCSVMRSIIFDWTPNMKSLQFNMVVHRYDDGQNSLPLGPPTVLIPVDGPVHNSPNLKMKKLELITNLGPLADLCWDQVKPFPIGWAELFAAYPNLKELSIDGWPCAGPVGAKIDQLLDELKIREKELKLQKVKGLFTVYPVVDRATGEDYSVWHLTNNVSPSNSHFSKFAQIKLPLTWLSLDIPDSIDSALVIEILRNLSSTLKTLTLNTQTGAECGPLFLPSNEISFPRLISLNVNVTFVLPTLDFLIAMPKLESLNVVSIMHNYPNTPDGTIGLINETLHRFAHVKRFNIGFSECLTKLTIRAIARIFPNLIDFTAHLNDKGLQEVFSSLTKLETLSVESDLYNEVDFITDYGITGIPADGLARGNDLSIALLTNLRHLTIRRCDQLSEKAVDNGIAHLNQLKTLSLGQNKISSACLRDLYKRLNLKYQKLCIWGIQD